VGSRPNKENLAYIAGFLDGDGSIMLQVKKRSDTTRGWRIMATICFYQDSRHSEPLNWIKEQLKIGYISKRNAVRQLKGYASWVQNVVRQFGPNLLWAWKLERSLT